MLQPLGLTYKLEDDVILITSPLATQAQTITQTYYVGDLVMPPDHAPQNLLPDKIFNREQNPQNDPNAGFGPNPGVFGPADPRYPAGFNTVGNATGERPKIDMTPIIQLITTSIAPGTWKVQDGYGQDASSAYGLGGGFGGDAGGIDQQRQPGAIVPFFLSISLIIKHTAEVHDQVADLLRQLRRLQDLQVSIEVRFITVNDTFFEFIGVDFDFEIQSDSVGKHSTFAIPNPAVSIFPLSTEHVNRDQHVDEHLELDRAVELDQRLELDERRHDVGGGGGRRCDVGRCVGERRLGRSAAVRRLDGVERRRSARAAGTQLTAAYIVNPILDHALPQQSAGHRRHRGWRPE